MYIFEDFLRGIATAYLIFVAVLVLVALVKPRTWRRKAIYTFVVLVVFVGPFTKGAIEDGIRHRKAKARYEEALALFDERCKTAGEEIYKVIPDVEGIYLIKVRPDEINFGNQYALTDPYGSDLGGDGYIGSFLRGNVPARKQRPFRYGYAYVEATDQVDGKRYRYTGAWKVTGRKDPTAPNIKIELSRNPNYDLNNYDFLVAREVATGPRPRYGVTFEDISTGSDRDHWIAGSSLRIIDLETGEMIAQRIGYMMDRAMGAKGGNRSPWLYAAETACPDFFDRFAVVVMRGPAASVQPHQTYDFVEKVLLPRSD